MPILRSPRLRLGGVSGGSTPSDSDITALSPALWLRASDLAQGDGTAVTSWTSREGNSIEFTQGTGTHQPTYETSVVNGEPAVRFGSDDSLNGDATAQDLLRAATGATVFIVAQATPILTEYQSPFFMAVGGAIGTNGGTTRFSTWKSDANEFASFARETEPSGTLGSATVGVFDGNWHSLVAQADLTNGRGFIRKYPGAGVAQVDYPTGAFADTASSNVKLGAFGQFDSANDYAHYFWNGDIAEVILFESALSLADVDTVLAVLNDRYALATEPTTVATWADEANAQGGVVVAGWEEADWTEGTAFSGGSASGRTFIDPAVAVRVNTTVRRVVPNHSAGSGGNKIKHYRFDGSAWDWQADESYTNAGTRQSVSIATPWSVQHKDVIGYFLDTGSDSIRATSGAGSVDTLYESGDLTAANESFANNIGVLSEIVAYGDRPYLALTGDSIIGGHTDWQTHLDTYTPGAGIDTIPGGDESFDVGQEIAALVAGLTWGNYAQGSQTFANIASEGGLFDAAANADPHTIVIAAGVNDVSAARTWSQVEADLDTIKIKFDRGGATVLAICEILPWTNGSDTQAGTIRTWNSNLATWCSSNGATLISCHDDMAQTRGSTGELDDLNSTYSKDGTHLSAAGIAEFASLIKTGLGL